MKITEEVIKEFLNEVFSDPFVRTDIRVPSVDIVSDPDGNYKVKGENTEHSRRTKIWLDLTKELIQDQLPHLSSRGSSIWWHGLQNSKNNTPFTTFGRNPNTGFPFLEPNSMFGPHFSNTLSLPLRSFSSNPDRNTIFNTKNDKDITPIVAASLRGKPITIPSYEHLDKLILGMPELEDRITFIDREADKQGRYIHDPALRGLSHPFRKMIKRNKNIVVYPHRFNFSNSDFLHLNIGNAAFPSSVKQSEIVDIIPPTKVKQLQKAEKELFYYKYGKDIAGPLAVKNHWAYKA